MSNFTSFQSGAVGTSVEEMGDDGKLKEWAKQPAHMRRFSVGARPDLHPELQDEENEYDDDEAFRQEQEMEDMRAKIEQMSERIDELKYEQDQQELEEEDSLPSSRNEYKTLDSFIKHEENVLIEHGRLYKKGAGAQSGGFFGLGGSKAWKERFFVISDNYRYLEYYRDDRVRCSIATRQLGNCSLASRQYPLITPQYVG